MLALFKIYIEEKLRIGWRGVRKWWPLEVGRGWGALVSISPRPNLRGKSDLFVLYGGEGGMKCG